MSARSRRPPGQVPLGARPAFGQRVPRPTRVAVPVLSTALTLGGWAVVAHNSGSGWVQALGALLGGFLAVGLLAPALVTWRVTLMAIDAPLDGVAGRPAAVVLSSNRAVRVTPLRPSGSDVVLDGRGPGSVLVVPPLHCELSTCTLRIASAAPFGLLWWYRDLEVPLVRPVLVAPRLARPDPEQVSELRRRDEAERRVPQRLGEPRGVREYRPGDLRHWVHWPATAHAGTLMVREMEAPLAHPVTVRVELPIDPEVGERLAERAFGTVGELLSAGRPVILITRQSDGEHSAPVTGLLDAGRRLARAVPLQPAQHPGQPKLPPGP